MAVALFTQARPPGIYKQDYLDKLYNMYVKDEESREMIQVMIIYFLKLNGSQHCFAINITNIIKKWVEIDRN